VTEADDRRVLVTGAAGFIGSHLCERLVGDGWSVVGLDDLSAGRRENLAALNDTDGFELVVGDACEEDVVRPLVERVDAVVHLAAVVGVRLTMDEPLRVIDNNIRSTHRVLDACDRYGRRVIIASSSEVYGRNRDVPLDETSDCVMGPPQRSRWSYATAKALDEHYAQAYHARHGLEVMTVRFFNTIGPRQTGEYGMVVPTFVEQALRREEMTVYGDGSQSRCFCDVRDVTRALAALLESDGGAGEVYNIGATREITILELARLVHSTVRPDADDAPIRLVPYEEAYGDTYEDIPRRVPGIDRVRDAIGWQPEIALEETIRSIAEARGGG